jgi:hypothetical protein
MTNTILNIFIIFLFFSCFYKVGEKFNVQALPIDAQVNGNVLTGPSVLYDPSWKGVHGAAISDSPKGPFIAADQIIFDIRLKNGKLASAEDPYVWYHKTHERFYAVFKDFSGDFTESEPGLAILKSADGSTWIKPDNPFFMKKEIILQSGEIINVKRLERPQLLIIEEGNPRVLYCACSIVDINPRKDGSSFNVHIPLGLD